MRVLALDTTTRAGSVALVEDAQIVDERVGEASRTHAERLPHEAAALVEERGLKLADVDLFAVASGPGSFTGLRIGIATVQGFAFVTRRPVVGVSILEVLGHLGSRGSRTGALVAAWVDAQRREVFSALYRIGPGLLFEPTRLVEVAAPAVGDPVATLERWSRWLTGEIWFIGDGAEPRANAIRAAAGMSAVVLGTPALAGAIGCMAEQRALAGEAVEPAGLRPLYVRRPDAILERERRG
jgi:tRNA threonylcarbamoyladenosine biosynthesis protein TsaB